MAARNCLEALALRVLTLVERARRAEKGQGMVEYGLILMIITVALIIIVSTIGRQADNMFSNVSNGLGQ
jgi:pilus assembly protein Flp/PilA